MQRIYTIGHSNQNVEAFLKLLNKHQITAVCDVRSSPYSRYTPQFNYEHIRQQLKSAGIQYVYLGKELGPRSEDPECYVAGRVRYQLLAQTELFQDGLQRIKEGMNSYTIALMCAEKDPVSCHRTILICRHLKAGEVEIWHILEDGTLENNVETEKRLMGMLKIPSQTLFETPENQVERAYDIQSERIAYKPDPGEQERDLEEGGLS